MRESETAYLVLNKVLSRIGITLVREIYKKPMRGCSVEQVQYEVQQCRGARGPWCDSVCCAVCHSCVVWLRCGCGCGMTDCTVPLLHRCYCCDGHARFPLLSSAE